MNGPVATASRVLRNGDLRRLLLAFLAFNAAEYATWIAILLYAYQASGAAAVGVIAVVQLVPAVFTAPLAASLGDRFPRRRVLAGGYLVYGAGMAATAGAITLAVPALVVYFVAAIGGAALVVTRPVQSALIPALSNTPDEATAANGAAQVVEGAGIVLGPIVAAIVVAVASTGVVFATAAAGLLLAGFLVLPGWPRSRAASRERGGQGPDREPAVRSSRPPAFLSGMRAVLDDADARLVVGLMSARMVMVGAADVLFVLMALELLDMGQSGAGVLNAAFGVGTIAGGALTFGVAGRGGLAPVATVGAVGWGVCLGAAGWFASAPLAVTLLVVGSAGLALVDLAGRTILQRAIRDEVLASVFGIQEGLAMGALAVGSIAVPALVVVAGLTGAIVLVAMVLPVVVLAGRGQLRSLDRRSVPRLREIELLRRTGLFGPLPGPQLEGIARRATWQTVAPGTTIVREGDRGDRYYVLERGRVAIDRGGARVRELAETGDGFGEIALLRNVPRTATVTATEPTTLLVIGRVAFLTTITGNPVAAAQADRDIESAIM